MRRICYSRFHIGDRFFGLKEPLENKEETHGICDECWPLEQIEIQIALKKLRTAGWKPFGSDEEIGR